MANYGIRAQASAALQGSSCSACCRRFQLGPRSGHRIDSAGVLAQGACSAAGGSTGLLTEPKMLSQHPTSDRRSREPTSQEKNGPYLETSNITPGFVAAGPVSPIPTSKHSSTPRQRCPGILHDDARSIRGAPACQ
jgi:hypothetical protein